MNKTTKDGWPYRKPGPKTDPSAPHNKRIGEIVEEMRSQGWEHIGGYNKVERYIQTPSGFKPYRRMDVSFRNPITGQELHVNVGLKRMRGGPIMRERRALLDVIQHSEGFGTDFLIKFRGYTP
jgi:hypothetical protein